MLLRRLPSLVVASERLEPVMMWIKLEEAADGSWVRYSTMLYDAIWEEREERKTDGPCFEGRRL